MAKLPVSVEIQNKIRWMYLAGRKQSQIANELGVSLNTVKKYTKGIKDIKKEASALGEAEEGAESSNNPIVDYSTSLTKMEEVFTKKIKKELWLYEDLEEGWSYHITEVTKMNMLSGRFWCFIVYPDSAPTDWIDKLEQLREQYSDINLEYSISPLHDHDWWEHDSPALINPETGELTEAGARYKIGDRKKAHWHCIITVTKRIFWREMNVVIQQATNCPYIQKCTSVIEYYNYFVHNTVKSRGKYQNYDKSEIIRSAGFCLLPNKSEQGLMWQDIFRVIKENDMTSIEQVVDFYLYAPEYMSMLNAKPKLVVDYCNARWRRLNPDYAKRITIVDEDGENVHKSKKKKG